MASIKKPGPYNPQKATAYVGKGVLKNGGNITPVPNGHLIKKDGTSLKNGGKVVKAGGQTHKVFKKKVDKGIGGGGDGTAVPASGGSSVGGNGRNGAVGENAVANTGSGGGGGGTLQNGGNGSNGIIIVRYLAN